MNSLSVMLTPNKEYDSLSLLATARGSTASNMAGAIFSLMRSALKVAGFNFFYSGTNRYEGCTRAVQGSGSIQDSDKSQYHSSPP